MLPSGSYFHKSKTEFGLMHCAVVTATDELIQNAHTLFDILVYQLRICCAQML